MVKIDTATKLLTPPTPQRTIIHEFHEVIAVLPSYKLSMIHLSINIELKKDYTESYLHINSSSKLYAGLRSEYIEKKALVHRQRQCNNFYTISFIPHIIQKGVLLLKHSFFPPSKSTEK